MPEVFVGIGSNVEPERHVRRAIAGLDSEFGPIAVSPVYRNAAVGFDGEDFLNLVVSFNTTLNVSDLVEVLRNIEQRCGRRRDEERWGPRTLDLDILLYGNEVHERPQLPRADILRRAFVLKPLADIAPEGRHPVNGKAFAELWAAFADQSQRLSKVELPEPAGASMSKRSAGEHNPQTERDNR